MNMIKLVNVYSTFADQLPPLSWHLFEKRIVLLYKIIANTTNNKELTNRVRSTIPGSHISSNQDPYINPCTRVTVLSLCKNATAEQETPALRRSWFRVLSSRCYLLCGRTAIGFNCSVARLNCLTMEGR